MRTAPDVRTLVWSRVRFDGGRHMAAVLAVGILLASVMVFQGISGGLGAGLAALIEEEQPHKLGYTQNSLFSAVAPVPESQLEEIRSWKGVVDATGRRVAPSGIERENTTGAIILAGVDFEADEKLVADAAPPAPIDSDFRFVSFGNRLAAAYGLFEGRWPRDDTEAVITAGLRGPGWAVGDEVVFEAPAGTRSATIVGVILNSHPAGFAVPGTTTVGHLLVADHLLDGVGFRAISVTTARDYESVRDVADRMRALWPESWRENKAQVEAFEERHYEAARTQVVLAAAARFVLLSGAATIFAMSLMLLNGERRVFGVLQALGLGRHRTTRYVAYKMTLLIAAGTMVGLAAGHGLLEYLPLPDLGTPLDPRLSWDQTAGAVMATCAAAIIGAAVASYMTLRDPPAVGLRLHE